MAEGEVVAPVVDAPVANTVIAPAAPVGGNEAQPVEGEKPVPKTYTDDDVKKTVSDRLAKERRRIERTVRAEVERDMLRRELETRTQQPPTRETQGKSKPLAKDFSDVDSYIDAVTDWKLEQREAAKQKEAREREPRERQANSQAEYARSLAEKLSAGPKKHEDFEDVVFGDEAKFTDPMVAAIHESDIGIDLAYYLGTHLEELERIAKMPPTRQVGELIKLEDKLKAPPKPSTAPPPIVPGAGNAGSKKDWSRMSTEEHIKAYRNRDKRK